MDQIENKKKISELIKLLREDKLKTYLIYDNGATIQRQEQWTIKQKSLLIHSILINRNISLIYVYKNNDIYYIIDGRSRILAINDFINNQFAISEKYYENMGMNLKDKTFNTLTLNLQHKIMNYKIQIIEQEGEIEDAVDTFIRCNQGGAVKPIELFRAKLRNHLPFLDEICGHKLFELLEFNSNNKYITYEMALYFLMLESNPGQGLSKTNKEDFVDSISNVKLINNKIKKELMHKLDYLFDTFNNYEYNNMDQIDKYLKKSHIIILYKILESVFNKKISCDNFFEWCQNFFFLNKNTRSLYWIESSRGSTTSKNSIDIRFKELLYNFEIYFSNDEDINGLYLQ